MDETFTTRKVSGKTSYRDLILEFNEADYQTIQDKEEEITIEITSNDSTVPKSVREGIEEIAKLGKIIEKPKHGKNTKTNFLQFLNAKNRQDKERRREIERQTKLTQSVN